MKNKPQWLIDAENEINQFAESKIGKMTEKEFLFHERQVNAGKAAGKVAVEKGIIGKDSLMNKALLESGWFQSEKYIAIRREVGNRVGPIQGPINAETWKESGNIGTTEGRSKGGKESIKKLLADPKRKERCSNGGKESGKKKTEARRLIIMNIVQDLKLNTEVPGKVIRLLCEKHNYGNYKFVLRYEEFIKKTYHGKNQHNPSMYMRIK